LLIFLLIAPATGGSPFLLHEMFFLQKKFCNQLLDDAVMSL
jgi:hypothetical protein